MSPIAVLLARPARHVWPAKHAAEAVERHVDWSARLAEGDTVASSAFELPPGLIAVIASNTERVATVKISGGMAGQAYEIVNRITTARRQVLRQAIKLRVRS